MTDPIRASEALAVRSLLEEVARMGDCIGRHTVGKIMEISDRAATWLAENPPGQIAQPPPPPEGEVGEPSDEEMLELTEDWPATTGPRHDLSGCPEVPLYSVFADEVVEFARAVLARWGHQPAPAAEGEVGELVEWLGQLSEMACTTDDANRLDRVIALLLQQQHPAPVPVAERLPGPEDCAPWPDDPDTQPWCWLGNAVDGGWEWHQRSPGSLTFIRDSYTHWLPAHALPLPAGEVQP